MYAHSPARNAVVVFSAALIGYSLSLQPWFEKNDVITLITADVSSLPNFTAPILTSQTCSVRVLAYMHESF